MDGVIGTTVPTTTVSERCTTAGLKEMTKAGMAAETVDDTIEMIQEDEEDPELAVRLVFNQIANEVNASGTRKKVELQPIEPEELEAEPEIAQALAH